MLNEPATQTATESSTESSMDGLTEIAEFGDRIGLLLYTMAAGGPLVLMQPITTHADDPNRRLKLPQQPLDFMDRKGGYNAVRLAQDAFGLNEEGIKIREWTDPIFDEDELPSKVVSIKRVKRIRTIWVSARLEVPVQDFVLKDNIWVPSYEVPARSQWFKEKTNTNLVNSLLPKPPQSHVH